MNYQVIIDYINREYDKDIKQSVMYDHIAQWRHWLEGDVKGFHDFYKKTDLNNNEQKTHLKRNRTNMLLKGAEDWASILLNEKTRITIDHKKSQLFVMGEDEISGVFGENDFWRCANELVATSRWSGTAACEVYVHHMDGTEKEGNLVSGKKIGINYLAADQIIPITYENGILKEAAFVSNRFVNGEEAYFVSIHLLNKNGTYDIESFYLDKNGVHIEKDGYGKLVHTGSPYPWFSLIRKSGVNIFDYDSPFGVSIISGSEDILKGLDSAFDNFITDFKLGRKMVLMTQDMFNTDADGKLIAPQEEEEQLFINAGDKVLEGKMYQEYNPQLRVAENTAGLQKMLDLFSMRIGLGAKRYILDGNKANVTTATQWVGERQEMIQNANKEMICIEKALKETVRAILWIGKNVLHEDVKPDALITVLADDSYIIDADTERAQWLQDLQLGLRSRAEFRMYFYGENEEDAKKNISPSFAELLQGMQAGVVAKDEVRRFLFPNETEEEAKKAIEEITAEAQQAADAAFAKQMEQQGMMQNQQNEFNRQGAMQDDDSEDIPEENENIDINDVPF